MLMGETAKRRNGGNGEKTDPALSGFGRLPECPCGWPRVYELTKRFPIEERYALADQARRSSRSVCANIAEAWRKRRYEAAFIAKLSDAEGEAAETQVHLEFAFHHSYLSHDEFLSVDDAYEKIIGQLVKDDQRAQQVAAQKFAASSMNCDEIEQRQNGVTATSPIRPFFDSPFRIF
jgi:four helix bundle protein